MSASFSRSGRKGIFAGCKSLLCPTGLAWYLSSIDSDHVYVNSPLSGHILLGRSYLTRLSVLLASRSLTVDAVSGSDLTTHMAQLTTIAMFTALHLVRPNGGSLIAAGVWSPGKNELATIRFGLVPTPSALSPLSSFSSGIGVTSYETPLACERSSARRSSWTCSVPQSPIRRGRGRTCSGRRTC